MSTSLRAARASALAASAVEITRYQQAKRDHDWMVQDQQRDFPTCRAAEFKREEEEHPAYAASLYAQQDEAWALYHANPTEDNLCEAQEMDKEVRKGVWYWAPDTCRCATCNALTAPTPPVIDSPLDFMGEEGADF